MGKFKALDDNQRSHSVSGRQDHKPFFKLNEKLDESRTNGTGFHIICRKYISGDVEMTALQLNSDDSIRKGGGATRKATSRDQQHDIVVRKSQIRAKINVRRKLLSFGADRLLTLTFRDNVTDIDKAWKVLDYFRRLMKRCFGERWIYVAVPEYQKRGAVHFHLAVSGYYKVQVVRKLWRIAAGEHQGNIDITSPKRIKKNSWNPKRIAGYLTKYITKSNAVAINRRRYASGGKIEVPQPMYAWLSLGLTHGNPIAVMADTAAQLTDKSIQELYGFDGYFPGYHLTT